MHNFRFLEEFHCLILPTAHYFNGHQTLYMGSWLYFAFSIATEWLTAAAAFLAELVRWDKCINVWDCSITCQKLAT